MSVEVAAFDVDGTLTVRDCVVPFLRRIGGRMTLVKAGLGSPSTVARSLAARDRDALKAHFVHHAYADRQVDHIDEIGIEFADHVANGWIRQDVARRLRWHQEQGHVVVLVSASLGSYLHPLGDMLEVDAVLCTEVETDGGTYTGRILGSNCRGATKVTRLRDWLSSSGLDHESVTYAYGDSSGDSEMLSYARTGVNVRKSLLLPGPLQ